VERTEQKEKPQDSLYSAEGMKEERESSFCPRESGGVVDLKQY